MTSSPPVAAVSRAPRPVAAGLMLISATVLLSQIALTRIMSVTVNYHSAFLILSVVMLGMAASAISVFVGMRRAKKPITVADSVPAAYRAAGVTFLAVFGFVYVVARDWGPYAQPVQLFLAAGLFFGWFYYCGFVVTLLLAHYAKDMSRLYWFDLVGAALGCLAVVPALNRLPALNVILFSAFCMAISGLLLARAHGGRRHRQLGVVLAGALLGLWALTAGRPDLLRLRFAKGQDQSAVRWEHWNAMARVSVTTEVPGISSAIDLYQQNQGTAVPPEQVEELRKLWQAGWGTSPAFRGEVPPALWIQLDTDAGTPIIRDGVAALGQKDKLEFLAWDVTAAGYELRAAAGRPPGRAFIVGGGGGRDVLTALYFHTKQVDVVELNPDVIEAVQGPFGDYSGRVYSHPRVNLTVGEARSVLSRRGQAYDLIQMSMIDTWASSMAGSLVMAENNLYTQEAFDLYVDRLEPDGLLSVSRWYDPVRYGESARTLVLMANSLRRLGVRRPEEHIAVVTCRGHLDTAVATLLLNRSPFTASERRHLARLCDERGYQLLWPHDGQTVPPDSPPVRDILRLDPQTLATSPYDLSPPTDDRPFFFNVDRPVESWVEAVRLGDFSRGSRSTLVLGATLLAMAYACFRFIVRPLRLYQSAAVGRPGTRGGYLAPLLYFGGIGLGFMLIEIALIQRYILFLGHPSHAVSVVLFTLLLCGGAGSYLTERVSGGRLIPRTRLALGGVLLGALLTALAVPAVLEWVHAWPWPARLVAAVALIGPLALFMGMIYPLGVRRLLVTGHNELVPWMWGINGICGVIGSVLGMLLAMNANYTVVLLLAAGAYGVTLLSLSLPVVRKSRQADAVPAEAESAQAVAVG
jgi:hypothetical protein